MRVLFDHCVPKPLRRHLTDHEVKTAYEMGWERLKNGKLLDAAQAEFDVLLTVDQNLPHQQNLEGRTIALVVLVAPDNTVRTLLPFIPQLLALLSSAQSARLYQVALPTSASNETTDEEEPPDSAAFQGS